MLLEKCKEFVPELSKFKTELVELSSYAVEIRYPGFSATNEEAEDAVLLTKKTRTIIRNYFNISEVETEGKYMV